MDQGLSYQVLAMGFAKERAGVQGCAVVKYHWGGKPGKYSQVPNYGNIEVLAYQFCEFDIEERRLIRKDSGRLR